MNEKEALQNPVRLRFAPSPTGYLHVGGARTALFNYLFARSLGGTFILRIEDTDRKRSTEEATNQMLSSLHWLGIDWDEGPEISPDKGDNLLKVVGEKGSYGPYFQSKRLSFYEQAVSKLIEIGRAYPCICSDEELAKKRSQSEAVGKPYLYDGKCRHLDASQVQKALKNEIPHSIRFLIDKSAYGEDGLVVFNDLVKKEVKFDLNLIGDFIIRKSDGSPTYNFAAAVDDAAMKITHVLRGDDHISNTPRQLVLYQALGYEVPQFAHIAMILSEKREKLSKREGAQSVLDFEREGYYPDAMLNHLALLGWSPEDGVEVISREKLKHSFRSMKFSSAPAVFHKDKLDYLNGLYIRNLAEDVFLKDVKDYLLRIASKDDEQLKVYLDYEKIDGVLLSLRGYCKKLGDFPKLLHSFFSPPKELSADLKKWVEGEEAAKLFSLACKHFAKTDGDFISQEEFSDFVKKAKQELSFAGKKFFMAMRVCLTGSDQGIELDAYLSLVRREKILQRFLEINKLVNG